MEEMVDYYPSLQHEDEGEGEGEEMSMGKKVVIMGVVVSCLPLFLVILALWVPYGVVSACIHNLMTNLFPTPTPTPDEFKEFGDEIKREEGEGCNKLDSNEDDVVKNVEIGGGENEKIKGEDNEKEREKIMSTERENLVGERKKKDEKINKGSGVKAQNDTQTKGEENENNSVQETKKKDEQEKMNKESSGKRRKKKKNIGGNSKQGEAHDSAVKAFAF